jgi:membrane-associated protein
MIDVAEILTGMSSYVPYISFGLLVLSGMSMPISEDIVIIISASIAATVAQDKLYHIFAGCLLGAYTSDIIAYTIGRFGIKKIIFSPFMVKFKIINPVKMRSRVEVMQNYFTSYGGKTLFFGRFVPFGMRNVIFMTSGLIKMSPLKFMGIDLCAVTCTSTILFSLGYSFGNNYKVIFPYLDRYKYVFAGLIVTVIALFIMRNCFLKRRNAKCNKIAMSKNLTGK